MDPTERFYDGYANGQWMPEWVPFVQPPAFENQYPNPNGRWHWGYANGQGLGVLVPFVQVQPPVAIEHQFPNQHQPLVAIEQQYQNQYEPQAIEHHQINGDVESNWNNNGANAEIVQQYNEADEELIFHQLYLEYQQNGFVDRNRDGHVKRPMNSFMVHGTIKRKMILENEPNRNNAEISKDLGTQWKQMTKEDKAPYVKKAKKLKKLHEKMHPGYKFCPRRRNTSVGEQNGHGQ